MPTPTYTPLANTTLGSSAASVTFSSISGSYRDLVFIATGTTSTITGVIMRFNGDSGSNYSSVFMDGYGSGSPGALTATGGYADVAVFSTLQANAIMNIMDYSATDKHKNIIGRQNLTDWGTRAFASRWASTSAITSLTISIAGGPVFAAGSTFTLYGIAS